MAPQERLPKLPMTVARQLTLLHKSLKVRPYWTVNRRVAGSSPTSGATLTTTSPRLRSTCAKCWLRDHASGYLHFIAYYFSTDVHFRPDD
jgi:hypothetical protein